MLPNTRSRTRTLENLLMYKGPTHPHEDEISPTPAVLEFEDSKYNPTILDPEKHKGYVVTVSDNEGRLNISTDQTVGRIRGKVNRRPAKTFQRKENIKRVPIFPTNIKDLLKLYQKHIASQPTAAPAGKAAPPPPPAKGGKK